MRPDAALGRLLDALEQEILSVSEDEIRDAVAGRSLGFPAGEVRDVARAAIANRDLSDRAALLGGLPSSREGRGRWHLKEAKDEHDRG